MKQINLVQINLITDCENCGEVITKRIADLTGGNAINLHLDMEIEGDGFDCQYCGQNTSVILQKESN